MSETCQACGNTPDIIYRMPDKVWSMITTWRGNPTTLCLACAAYLAKRAGIRLFWEARIGACPTSKETA